ncbi:TPA: hypothetical protein EYO63_11910 [Candidatus Poribacteria bacterium]|nr:hypothetical protein [Candidatus Poribacteria bacterium]
MYTRLPRPVYIVLLIMILFALGVPQLISQESGENQNIVAFEIQSLLSKKCYDCHGVDRQKSGLRLDDRPRALAGGNSKKAGIVPGDAVASAIVYRMTLPSDHESAMPPKDREKLTSDEILKIIHWIYSGANWPVYTDDQELDIEKSTEETVQTTAPSPSGKVEGQVNYNRDILSVFAKNCTQCHGTDDKAADLSLDSATALSEANADGEIIVPGNPEESELFRRISLPAGDGDIMPPAEEGDPLTQEQIELIRQWIAEGANFGEIDSEDETADSEAELVRVLPASDQAMAALKTTGALALPLAQDTNFIQVDFSLVSDQIGDEHLSLLTPVAEQLSWLNLSKSKVSDAGLELLAKFTNLKRLHLENTEIGDAGLTHLKSLPNLEYLNLYGTNISDAGLQELTDIKNLKKVYLWRTKVTEDGIPQLRAARPELDISFGWEYELKQKLLDRLGEPISKSLKLSQTAAIAAIVNLVVKDDLQTVSVLEKEIDGKRQALVEQKAKTEQEAYTKLVSLFDEGSCCANAHKDGKKCDHQCCLDAFAQNKVCSKCNPGAAEQKTN